MSRTTAQAEASLFSDTVASLRAAFELRKPDAWETALLLRGKYALAAEVMSTRCMSSPAAAARAREACRRLDSIDEVLRDGARVNLLLERGQYGPTPETWAKPGRADCLRALLDKGHLDDGQEIAAREIAQIFEAVTRALNIRPRTLERTSGGTGDHLPPLLSDWYSARYLPWIGAMMLDLLPCDDSLAGDRCRQHLPLVMKVVVDGISLGTARRQYGMGWSRSLDLLRNGLDLYAWIRARHRDGITFDRWRQVALGRKAPASRAPSPRDGRNAIGRSVSAASHKPALSAARNPK